MTETYLISFIIITPIPCMYFTVFQDCKFRSTVRCTILSKGKKGGEKLNQSSRQNGRKLCCKYP